MGTTNHLLEQFAQFGPDQQQEVLDFVDFLAQKYARSVSRKSSYGLWAVGSPEVEEEEIAQARREMWSRFPRDDVMR